MKVGKLLSGMGGERKREDDTLVTALSRGADKSIKSIEAEELGKLTAGSKLSKSKFNTAAAEILRKQVATQYNAMFDKNGNLMSADGKNPVSQELAERIASETNTALSIFSNLSAQGIPDARAFQVALQARIKPQAQTVLSAANPGAGGAGAGAKTGQSVLLPRTVSPIPG